MSNFNSNMVFYILRNNNFILFNKNTIQSLISKLNNTQLPPFTSIIILPKFLLLLLQKSISTQISIHKPRENLTNLYIMLKNLKNNKYNKLFIELFIIIQYFSSNTIKKASNCVFTTHVTSSVPRCYFTLHTTYDNNMSLSISYHMINIPLKNTKINKLKMVILNSFYLTMSYRPIII